MLMLSMACTLFRMTPVETLAGVTRNSTVALDYEGLWVLEKGRRADFMVWDIRHPTELSYRIGFNPCRTVVQEGNIVRVQCSPVHIN